MRGRSCGYREILAISGELGKTFGTTIVSSPDDLVTRCLARGPREKLVSGNDC
jgi:hypothetical protein